ncbi:hypothetical protein OPKNFCMD_1491 [Methylobacterium crusticola]|uniref:Type II toxin-antitoxin system RelE/ParE family toxin n=1 Tax=Methylobacterium crusticola TaxID=1697972 RepID=A0ABQ4QTV8_9HYPH|nr:type II toxin-antitoxin system RelE/ParE family toxin [Methylobacterium crusticola]GJD48766.1 hypothetical protein OPKNFCMD_1491 [Methylobacterium crusticola]
MFDIRQTPEYERWFLGLQDVKAITRILARVRNLSLGNAGDAEPVGEGVSEIRIHYGPGYRVYYKRSGKTIYLLLCGGDKSTQKDDIRQAKALAAEMED